MKLDKLFNVLVIAGASSTVGLLGCGGDDDDGGGEGAGGASAGSGGAAAGTGGAAGDACEAVCEPGAIDSWTDCNGCCCWLPAGTTSPAGICGAEPCCEGRGR